MMNRRDMELMAGIAKVTDYAYKTIPGFISADQPGVHVTETLFLEMLDGLSKIEAREIEDYSYYRVKGRWNGTEFFALFNEVPDVIEEALEDEE